VMCPSASSSPNTHEAVAAALAKGMRLKGSKL
jgi:hypothetical protein